MRFPCSPRTGKCRSALCNHGPFLRPITPHKTETREVSLIFPCSTQNRTKPVGPRRPAVGKGLQLPGSCVSSDNARPQAPESRQKNHENAYTGAEIKLRGGEDGIRTHDTLLRYTPLAGERLRPLGHLSVDRYHPENSAITDNTAMYKAHFQRPCR